ncbi:SOS response-associated peptidase [Candidatus Saccharibacteria bacterium]|nr:SOS response-associated peptidase [Candidatus Saccharibacteria bacterium]
MCGRYTFYSSEELLKQFELQVTPELQLALEMKDNYNVSPGAHMPVIVRGEQSNHIEFMVWGLVPAWSKSPQGEMKLINARAENLTEKPMWHRLLKSKRCIIPARGFYEWKSENGKKQPYYIQPKNSSVFSFAGLYDHWQDSEGVELLSFTIITTTPNQEMSAIHNRMPVILDRKTAEMWLSPVDFSHEQIHDLMSPAPDDTLEIFPVSTKVNYAGHNEKELIYPLPTN